jgi:hypothetical protein
MIHEFTSIIKHPGRHNVILLQDWLDKRAGVNNLRIRAGNGGHIRLNFTTLKHRRMFNLYAEMLGIIVYNYLGEYELAQMERLPTLATLVCEQGEQK